MQFSARTAAPGTIIPSQPVAIDRPIRTAPSFHQGKADQYNGKHDKSTENVEGRKLATGKGKRKDEHPADVGEHRDEELSSEFDSDEDDEDDPVVKRLPVYLTPHYVSSLTLLQFLDKPPRPNSNHPLLPPNLRPDKHLAPSASLITARYKPTSQHLEITVPIEKNPLRWNEDKAKELGKGVVDEMDVEGDEVSGKGKGKGKKRKDDDAPKGEKQLDRLIYHSHVVPDATNYLVGIVKDDALHLNPVTQTYQLRAALTYLDTILADERRAKTRANKLANDEDDDEDDEDDPADDTGKKLKLEASKAVQVSIKQSADLSGGGAFGKGGGNGGSNGRADASLFDPLRAKESEAWVNLIHYHAETVQSSIAFEDMYVEATKEKIKLESTTKPSEYLQC